MENVRQLAGMVTQRKVLSYILQAYDLMKTQAENPVITLNGVEDPEANTQLEKLFEKISSAVDGRKRRKRLITENTEAGAPRTRRNEKRRLEAGATK